MRPGATAAMFLTVLPALACVVFVALSVRYLRRTPLHPLSPLTFRADAARLQRWEGFKMRVKFERLRESWELRAHREALARALKEKRRMKKGKAIKGDSRYGKAKRPLPPRVEGAWGEDPKQRGLQRPATTKRSAIDLRLRWGDDDTQPHGQVAQRRFERAIATLAAPPRSTRTSARRAARVASRPRRRHRAEGITPVLSRVFAQHLVGACRPGRVGRAMGIIFDARSRRPGVRLGGARRRRARLLPDGQARAGTVAAVCATRDHRGAPIAFPPKEAHRAGARQRQRRSPRERRTRD